ncbi:MAG: nuclear transport factor 2 family protein [Candidatus Acidiferrales bacterium]
MRQRPQGFAWVRCFATLILILVVSSGAWAQKKQKKPANAGQPLPSMPVAAQDQIDRGIGEMLGAFQVGNVEEMHKHYADNATFVRGTYEPPLAGWNNYVAVYQQGRASVQAMQIIRRDTNIYLHGDIAWAAYQWQLDYLFQGRQITARGQTTLVLNKVGDNWLIVHNHTSQICDAVAPAQQPAQTPAASTPPKP